MEYNFRAARDEVMRTTRIYRALKSKGMLSPEVGENLKARVVELEQEIAEAKQKIAAGHGSHFFGSVNFLNPIIPESEQVSKV